MHLNAGDAPLFAYFAAVAAALDACGHDAALTAWSAQILTRARMGVGRDRRLPRWQQALAALPPVAVTTFDLTAGVGLDFAPFTPAARATLEQALLVLAPWRKGPFELGDLLLDAEWRADWKWARVLPHVAPLAGRRVLDVGCGNGYYAWRMAGAGAGFVLGLDPSWPALVQFLALRRYLPQPPVFVLPVASGALDARIEAFDTVFSMGVLYHRRDPVAHLRELHRALRAGGELVLETLVINDGSTHLLVPAARYCAMRNVWAVPAPAQVESWLGASGYTAVRCVDITATTIAEQRSTRWMTTHSLADFLDPHDHTRTIEGYPAPVRAIFIATAQ